MLQKSQPRAAGLRLRNARIVRRGDVYLANDKAERKATGSYYTPENIVEYIVDHTVGPVLQRKLDALVPEFRKAEQTYHRLISNAAADSRIMLGSGYLKAGSKPAPEQIRAWAAGQAYDAHRELVEKLFDLKVLDPAMGSGHFLVDAVDFVTDKLLVWLNQFRPFNPVLVMLDRTRRNILESLNTQGVNIDPDRLTDVHLLKRHVLKRCIYGVDLNPLATELAKVSLWLDAFTLGAPLSFLDHHLRVGNSLIGATFDDLEKLTSGSLFAINFEPMLRAVRNVLTVSRLSDTTAAEVHESASKYGSARQALDGYRLVLDLIVAQHFGQPKSIQLITQAGDLHLDSRERFVMQLNEREGRMVRDVEAISAGRRFFHWELEFPEVFFHYREGSRQQIEKKKQGDAGFDCVIGNPPYDELSEHAAGKELPEKRYFKASAMYADSHGGRINLFRLFSVLGNVLLANPGRHSFIVPMSLMGDTFTLALRRSMLRSDRLREIVAFPHKDNPNNRVFFEAKLSTCIFVCEKPASGTAFQIRTFPKNSFMDDSRNSILSVRDLEELDPENLSIPATSSADIERWRVIHRNPRVANFRDVARCYLGELMTNASNAHLTTSVPKGPRLLRGANINRYVLLHEPKQGEPLYLRESEYLREYADDPRSRHHTALRIGFQESSPIDNWRRLLACVIPAGHYCVHKIRYFAADSRYDLHALLAIFNSAMCDWRFSLTSTNNSVNQYEVDALPLPRFERLSRLGGAVSVDSGAWMRLLGRGVSAWEAEATRQIRAVTDIATEWPNAIHDALAVAGHEMVRIAETRQSAQDEFVDVLVKKLRVNEESFTGLTFLRGGQATLEEISEDAIKALLEKNRAACGNVTPAAVVSVLEAFRRATLTITADAERYRQLDAAIDSVVWQVVGLNPSGRIAERGA